MPISIKAANLKYKNSQGQYVGVNSISDRSTAEQLAAIQAAGTENLQSINTAGVTQIQAVNTKGEQVMDSIPETYTA